MKEARALNLPDYKVFEDHLARLYTEAAFASQAGVARRFTAHAPLPLLGWLVFGRAIWLPRSAMQIRSLCVQLPGVCCFILRYFIPFAFCWPLMGMLTIVPRIALRWLQAVPDTYAGACISHL